MGLGDRLRGRRQRPGTARGAGSADLDHLADWAGSRRGVEGFVEPETSTTATTLVLVAGDGEWTRRRVVSPKAAFTFGSRAGIPVYDVAAVGYPNRMREWTARRKAAGETGVPGTRPPS
ncbi:MAG: oxidoreductase [Mycobacteriales bacterium]